MADEAEAAPASIKDRIAALKLNQVGKVPGSPDNRFSNGTAPTTTPRPRPPPPPRPSLPARPERPQSASVPPTSHVPSANRPIGNLPQQPISNGIPVNGSNGTSRPPLPSRTSSSTTASPALPPRRPSDRPSPALPPRRPSEGPSQPDFDRNRRGSTESTSSVATARSSISGISTATSLTSQGDRSRIRAPDFDPNALPALPPKRTKEEREAHDRKYANVRPFGRTKSTPKIEPIGTQGTTPPPPARQVVVPPPALPSRPAVVEQAAPEMPPRPGRRDVPSLPSRAEPELPQRPKKSALSMGFGNKLAEALPVQPPRPEWSQSNGQSQNNDAPPPIPSLSKPDLKALLASKPKPNGASATSNGNVGTPAKPIAISSYSQYNDIVSSTQLVVADFYADWCGPCRNLAPDYEKLSLQLSRPSKLAFLKINTDHNTDIRDANGIRAWPTIIFYDNGREVHKMEGASKESIEWKLNEVADNAGVDLTASSIPSDVHSNGAGAGGPASGSCMHCRDFSGPDNHAARFPRESMSSFDIGWLANQLCSPFPSQTDKARAIFTWQHHNIAYDTVAFFGNNVKPSTPQSTLQTGLAVCEGYAGLFAAIAIKAGLEAIVVGGHGKGYGHAALKPGDPVPPYSAGHAWNAVKIDGGEWKLIDCCWGAGTVNGPNEPYKKGFNPEKFTQSNDEFGLDHYPEDSSKQFRNDGRRMSWEEYITGNKDGCGADFFSGYVSEEGLAKTTFQPADGKISLSQQHGPTVRFSFQKICPHWDPVRCGRGPYYLYLLHLEGLDGTDRNNIPFNTNGDVWWCDVPTRDLGHPRQKAQIWAVNSFNNKDGRGVTIDEYKRKKGRVGMGFGFCCTWEIAP